MLSSFIICISLFVAFSVEGQVLPDGRGADDPLVQALRWERVVYGSDDPVRTHQALEAKAGCYAEAGLFEDAVATLERIRMYLLEACGQFDPVDLGHVYIQYREIRRFFFYCLDKFLGFLFCFHFF